MVDSAGPSGLATVPSIIVVAIRVGVTNVVRRALAATTGLVGVQIVMVFNPAIYHSTRLAKDRLVIINSAWI